MTDTKFTPGPWLLMDYNADETFPRWCVVPKSCIGTIAHVQSREANAHLIAAAPDLYAALEMVSLELHAGDDALDSMYADLTGAQVQAICDALAKARGDHSSSG